MHRQASLFKQLETEQLFFSEFTHHIRCLSLKWIEQSLVSCLDLEILTKTTGSCRQTLWERNEK